MICPLPSLHSNVKFFSSAKAPFALLNLVMNVESTVMFTLNAGNCFRSGTTGITDFADLSFTTATITAMGALIYNDTNGNKAVAVLDFSSNKTSTSGTFTVQFPTADASNAIIRIA